MFYFVKSDLQVNYFSFSTDFQRQARLETSLPVSRSSSAGGTFPERQRHKVLQRG